MTEHGVIEPVRCSELHGAEECWQRLAGDLGPRGVEARRFDDDTWPWTVTVWIADLVAEGPLEPELHLRVKTALESVPGVRSVSPASRGVWHVDGWPSGRNLVAAVVPVVDSLAERSRPLATSG